MANVYRGKRTVEEVRGELAENTERTIDAMLLAVRAGYQTTLAMAILGLLSPGAECTPGEIADALEIKSSQVTEVLKRLAANNHITRRQSETDLRVNKVRITAAGKELIETIIDTLYV